MHHKNANPVNTIVYLGMLFDSKHGRSLMSPIAWNRWVGPQAIPLGMWWFSLYVDFDRGSWMLL